MTAWRCAYPGGCDASLDGGDHGPFLETVTAHLRGAHGDVPLEPTAGRLVADLVAEERLTCVLDVSEMTKADMRRFLHDFADRLYRRNTEPLHVFCEEADEYIPQMVRGESAKVVGAFETLVKRGGFKGIGITLITQRSASMNKDVLTQCGSLFVLRTTSPQDQKAVLAWIKYHAAAEETIAELSGMENGEAFFYSPQFERTLRRVQFRRRRTFDSGATPKVGGKPRPPARLADVDLAAIKEAMAETIERAKADDPAELRKRIRVLETEMSGLRRQLEERPVAEPVVETVEVPVLDDALVVRLEAALEPAAELLDRLSTVQANLVQAARAGARDAVRPTRPPPADVSRETSPRVAARPARATVIPATDGESLTGGELKILTAAAQYPGGVTREQLTVLTGYRRSSRDTYMQRLRARGYVETGPTIVATETGVAALGGGFEPLPTGAALRAYWLDRLTGGEGEILRILLDHYPSGVDREVLSEVTGYKRSSRDTYLQRLRARQLVTITSGAPRAADTLFDD